MHCMSAHSYLCLCLSVYVCVSASVHVSVSAYLCLCLCQYVMSVYRLGHFSSSLHSLFLLRWLLTLFSHSLLPTLNHSEVGYKIHTLFALYILTKRIIYIFIPTHCCFLIRPLYTYMIAWRKGIAFQVSSCYYRVLHNQFSLGGRATWNLPCYILKVHAVARHFEDRLSMHGGEATD